MATTEEVLSATALEVKRIGGDMSALNASVQKSLETLRTELNDSVKSQADPIVKERIEAFGTEITAKLEAGQKSLTDRMDTIETGLKRSGGSSGSHPDDVKADRQNAILFTKSAMIMRGEKNIPDVLDDNKIDFEGHAQYRKGFAAYMRSKDDKFLSVDAAKALSSGSDPDGGYMVEPAVSSRIIEKIYESSPLRRLATVETISGTELEIKLDMDEVDFEWVGETDLVDETETPKLGKKRLVCHTMAARPKATQQLLEDSSVDMAAWLARKTGEKFARGEARAFLLGTGRGMPRGMLTYADGTTGETIERLPSGAAAGYTLEGLVEGIYSLKEGYHARASWLMRRTSIPKVMLIKDGDGRFIFQVQLIPGQKGLASSLLGYSLDMAADMPDLAAGSIGAAFGDFQAGYTIVDRLGITTLRDPYTVKPFVEFYTRKRVGGDVVNFEAFKLFKGAARAA